MSKGKVLKFAFIGYWNGFTPSESLVYKIASKNYQVELVEPWEADYILFSSLGDNTFEYMKYPAVRIFESYENVIPNFNSADYAISTVPIYYADRSFYMPYCCTSRFFPELSNKDRNVASEGLVKREFFASFIASHESEYSIRGNFFKELSKYKRVESVGTYLNNMKNNYVVDWNDDSKTAFQSRCKFNLCFESTNMDGFITEKIVDAFFAGGIPVYYGSEAVKDIFNPESFVFLNDYKDRKSCIEHIIELDNDDSAYIRMASQPILTRGDILENKMASVERFILHIFQQPLNEAYRRPRCYRPKDDEDYILGRMNARNVIKEASNREILSELKRRSLKTLKR